MKNNNLLKQNLLILMVVAIPLCLFYFLMPGDDLENFLFLFLLNIAYALIAVPLICLQYFRLKKGINTQKLNKALRIVNKIFIIFITLTIIFYLALGAIDLFSFYAEGAGFFGYIYSFFLSVYYEIIFTDLNDILNWTKNIIPALTLIILLYISNKFNRKMEVRQ